MSNKEKRAKRAKAKAKGARIAKQRMIEGQSITHPPSYKEIPPEVIEVFKKLPSPSQDYQAIDELKAFAQQGAEDNSDHEGMRLTPLMHVAMLYTSFEHWFTTGQNKIPLEKLSFGALRKTESPDFREAMGLKEPSEPLEEIVLPNTV